jgi:hypothetical protein
MTDESFIWNPGIIEGFLLPWKLDVSFCKDFKEFLGHISRVSEFLKRYGKISGLIQN